jgi:biofilm protein TabA
MKLRILFLVLASFMLTSNSNVQAEKQGDNRAKKKVLQWFRNREWAGTMTLKADKSVDVMEFAKQYTLNRRAWDRVFDWLAKNDPTTFPVGKYVLDSANISLTVTDAPSVRAFKDTKWEAHRDKIDLQYIARGQERMGITPVKGGQVVTPFNEKKDVGFYQVNEKKAKYVLAKPGTFLLFFPSDAHRPNIRVEGCDTVRKIVFKIRVVSGEGF